MKMTMEQYITNPMQSGVFTATMRESMRNSYVNKFNAILLREHGVFNYFLYKDEENNKFYAYFKIPSETVERFYYDTVIEFSADENIKEAGQNLFKYNVRFFSNDPSFVYTYAYVFKQKGLLIPELESRMSQRALKEAANKTNPYNQVGYVKSIYFVYLFMKLRSFNDLSKFKAQASVLNISNLSSNVMDADKKLGERENAGQRVQRKKKIEKEKKARDEERRKKLPESLQVKHTTKIGPSSKKNSSTGSKFNKPSMSIKHTKKSSGIKRK